MCGHMVVPLFPGQLPWHAVPSRIHEPHTFWTLVGWSLLCCCASHNFCPGALSLLPTPPHHASASGASWIKIVVVWSIFEISMMFGS